MTSGRYAPELLPPEHGLERIGGGSVEDYIRIGEEFFGYFTQLAGLKPTAAVLDIGCGYGRMALPLLAYLRDAGHYEGFDVIADAIDWLRSHIQADHPRFQFTHADLANQAYNPGGSRHDYEYTFPYPDAAFDFVFATSVFTHMLSAGVERYLAEVRRVLRPGGHCLFTWFVRNDESVSLIAANRSSQPFLVDFGVYSSTSATLPEAAVCYAEDYVLDLYRRNSLAVVDGIRPGAWCGREQYLSYQDIIIAEHAGGRPIPAPRLDRPLAAWAKAASGERAAASMGATDDVVSAATMPSEVRELAAARQRIEELAREQGRLQVQLAIAEGAISRRLRRWVRRRLDSRRPRSTSR